MSITKYAPGPPLLRRTVMKEIGGSGGSLNGTVRVIPERRAGREPDVVDFVEELLSTAAAVQVVAEVEVQAAWGAY
jgi:hypothetical protein